MQGVATPVPADGVDDPGRKLKDSDGHEAKRATVDRVPAIAETLARAFVDDPTFGLFVGDAGVRASGRRRFLELLDTPLAQLGFVGEIGDADAAAAWVPPHSSESWASVDASTRPLIRELGGEWDWVIERIPDEPVWFLDHIGVHPSMQGKGLGRALIDHGLMLASADRYERLSRNRRCLKCALLRASWFPRRGARGHTASRAAHLAHCGETRDSGGQTRTGIASRNISEPWGTRPAMSLMDLRASGRRGTYGAGLPETHSANDLRRGRRRLVSGAS